MSPGDHGVSTDFPFQRRDVYGALVAAVKGMRTMGLVSADDHACSIVVKPVAGLLSFRRDIVLAVIETSQGSSSIVADVSPRATRRFSGPLDAGQDRRNIGAIMDATSSELGRRPPGHDDGPASADDARIADMKSLLDRGFITQEEFDRWSAEIRNGR
jgi:hypothetical protein